MLGSLVLINFCTQLGIDLIFTFFTKYFNAGKIVKVMPVITSFGLACYAVIPSLFPSSAYLGLVIGTVIFSVSAGLSEVLLSPTIAAIPSDNAGQDMSFLHSLYAFGVFTMVVVSTVFLKIFGTQNWMFLIIILAFLPLISAVLFQLSPMPDMDMSETASKCVNVKQRTVGLALCVAILFFGSCAENTMSNWISDYMETALGIDKAVGDILGVAVFAILLGIARILYAKFGKNIVPVLFFGMICSVFCYITAGVTSNVYAAFFACIFTGFCTSMLWPGTLIMMEEKIVGVGVAAYALMASGGDLGASVAPQLMGIVIDRVSVSEFANSLALKLSITPEQVGLKTGMLITSVFPVLGTVMLIIGVRYFKRISK